MTIEQLAVKVLSKLGIHQAGNSVQAADLENVSDAYTGIYHELNDDGLVYWALKTGEEFTEIPDRLHLSLTNMIASEIGPFYNIPSPPEGWLKYKALASNVLRHQLASGQPTETVKAEYF